MSKSAEVAYERLRERIRELLDWVDEESETSYSANSSRTLITVSGKLEAILDAADEGSTWGETEGQREVRERKLERQSKSIAYYQGVLIDHHAVCPMGSDDPLVFVLANAIRQNQGERNGA